MEDPERNSGSRELSRATNTVVIYNIRCISLFSSYCMNEKWMSGRIKGKILLFAGFGAFLGENLRSSIDEGEYYPQV